MRLLAVIVLLLTSCLGVEENKSSKCVFNVDDATYLVGSTSLYQYDYAYKADSIVAIKIKDASNTVTKDLSFRYNSNKQLSRVVDKLSNQNEVVISYNAENKWAVATFRDGSVDSAFYNGSGALSKIVSRNSTSVSTFTCTWQDAAGTTIGKNLKKIDVVTHEFSSGHTTTETIDFTFNSARDYNNLYHGFFGNILSRILPDAPHMYTVFSFIPTNYNLATIVKHKKTMEDLSEITRTDSITYTFTSDFGLPFSVKKRSAGIQTEAKWTNVCGFF